jgi:hypothetical protein
VRVSSVAFLTGKCPSPAVLPVVAVIYAQTPTAGMICFNDFRVGGGGGGVVGLSFELQGTYSF